MHIAKCTVLNLHGHCYQAIAMLSVWGAADDASVCITTNLSCWVTYHNMVVLVLVNLLCILEFLSRCLCVLAYTAWSGPNPLETLVERSFFSTPDKVFV